MEKLKIVLCSVIAALLSSCGGGSSSGVMEDSMKIKTECESVNVSFEILKEMTTQLSATIKREGITWTDKTTLLNVYDVMSIDEIEDFKNNGLLLILLEAERIYHIKELRDWNKRDWKNCPNFNKMANLETNLRSEYDYTYFDVYSYNTKSKFISAFPTFPKDVWEHYGYLFEAQLEAEQRYEKEQAEAAKAAMEDAGIWEERSEEE